MALVGLVVVEPELVAGRAVAVWLAPSESCPIESPARCDPQPTDLALAVTPEVAAS